MNWKVKMTHRNMLLFNNIINIYRSKDQHKLFAKLLQVLHYKTLVLSVYELSFGACKNGGCWTSRSSLGFKRGFRIEGPFEPNDLNPL